ncbi:hypothetical protein [Cupriavidus basilensis]|uniref:hypothetical protein n=1 Tax=Cupriavidus basilensis TaxID=68895 RepID=UPI0020A6B1DF|nr:hypothetical protein [Cupriavidus basilensis]MCP3019619.1 hypothetical protein [Cupriavidus basilensis]
MYLQDVHRGIHCWSPQDAQGRLSQLVREMACWRDKLGRMVMHHGYFADRLPGNSVRWAIRDGRFTIGEAACAFDMHLRNQVRDAQWISESQWLGDLVQDSRNFLCSIYCVGTLEAIDTTALNLKSGNAGAAVVSAMEAAEWYNAAIRVLSGNRAQLSMAHHGGKARHRQSNKEKRFVYECWQDWKSGKTSYPSGSEFARDMLDKCEHIKSVKSIETWLPRWAKGEDIPQS